MFGYTRKHFRLFSCLLFLFIGFAVTVLITSTAQAKTKSLKLTYDGAEHTYKDVQGKLNYNHNEIRLSTMPILKLDGVLYAPAQELLETIFGFSWSYDESTCFYTATDPDVGQTVSFKAGDYSIYVDAGGQETQLVFKAPVRMIRRGEEPEVPCIPIKKLLNILSYTNEWNASRACLTVQKTFFFDWNEPAQASDGSTNYVYRATGDYQINDDMAFINLHFYGDLQSSYDSVTINRQDNIITVKIPKSVFLPDKNLYDRFGEIVEKMEISEDDESVIIVLTCTETTEFTYMNSDNDLNLRLMWDYSTQTGKITNYSLTILRPENVWIDSVSNVDCYDSVKYSKSFKIIIKGNYKEFFEKNPIVINNDSVKKIKISLNSDDNTVIRVTNKSLQGYRITRQGDYFVVLMNRPKKLYKNIIVLDAGHGDYDNGASHYGVHEKNLNLKMICSLMKPYFNQNDPEIKVYWTRTDDSFVTLDDRSKFAGKVGADAFISLHMNSASNTSANGTEVYYSTDNNKKGFGGIRSSIMADRMDEAIVDELDMEDRGVKTAGFYVIKRNSVPAILIELGFLSGSTDHKKLTDPSFQKNATKTIANVITGYFTDYPTGR